MAKLGINVEGVAPEGDYSPLEEGWYLGTVVDSDVKEAKTKGNYYAEFKYSTDIGPSIWDRVNVVNSSEKAQQIGLSRLRAMVDAAGVDSNVVDTEVFHGKVFALYVLKEPYTKSDGTPSFSNHIKTIKAAGDLEKDSSFPPAEEKTTTAPTAGPAQNKLPWEK